MSHVSAGCARHLICHGVFAHALGQLKAFPVVVVGCWAMVIGGFTGHSVPRGKAPLTVEGGIAIASLLVWMISVALICSIVVFNHPRFLIPPGLRTHNRDNEHVLG